ncbi:hypothetical protein AAY473_008822 [Plecturocebus cupreus]
METQRKDQHSLRRNLRTLEPELPMELSKDLLSNSHTPGTRHKVFLEEIHIWVVDGVKHMALINAGGHHLTHQGLRENKKPEESCFQSSSCFWVRQCSKCLENYNHEHEVTLKIRSLTLSPRLECSSIVSAHCNAHFLGSSNSPALDSRRRGFTMLARLAFPSSGDLFALASPSAGITGLSHRAQPAHPSGINAMGTGPVEDTACSSLCRPCGLGPPLGLPGASGAKTRSHTVTQSVVQWGDLSSLQLPFSGFKQSSCLSLPSSWDYHHARLIFCIFSRDRVSSCWPGWSRSLDLMIHPPQHSKVLGLQAGPLPLAGGPARDTAAQSSACKQQAW